VENVILKQKLKEYYGAKDNRKTWRKIRAQGQKKLLLKKN